jgi:hypothetical protein
MPEAGYDRSIDLRYNKTVEQDGRHTRISNKARTVAMVNQTRMMQGGAKKESTIPSGLSFWDICLQCHN